MTLAIMLGGALNALAPTTGLCDLAYTNWSREVGQSTTERRNPFYLVVMSSIDEQLFALGTYQFVRGRTPTVLQGTRGPEGDFCPIISYEVATKGKANWKRIGKSSQAAGSESVTISADNPTARLKVDMQQFRPIIEDFRWGRLVLENGDAAVFELEDLLPPADRRGAGDNFKEALDEREGTRFGSSAILYSVTSIGNRWTGVFVYSPRSLATLKGTETPDEDFWPSVTLYVGNSDQDWRAIDVAGQDRAQTSIRISNKNSPVVLRVSLDLFKPSIEKYKYGKVVFSDGSFAVFLIENLSGKR